MTYELTIKKRRKYQHINTRSVGLFSDSNFGKTNFSISDEEAIVKANSLSVEDQLERFSNYETKENPVTNQLYQQSPSKKENRVPGLYGCNRYKSRRNVADETSGNFVFF
ncbi:hypothetical protein EWS92_17995 [Vibrio vulnificus]|uniref:hypothetical protein n=1 Tax=Vibrio cholerae TaxID=666 RepID=UPI001A2158F5|nr:hypothetical protein [Vibrio cholerae]EGR0791364.1 hypothetical protein [Vibrio vulnificus]EGR0798901.1 hypothetical protein [Vibrio vulnificus]EGR0880111.1 hypothetical protein [Vibrio vulnificus]EGR5273681.1 hypothetical protein [Vibrio vulnificus]MDV2351050.1 hypothetical protein [Vibrio cholerae]